jgi:antitoxin HicB
MPVRDWIYPVDLVEVAGDYHAETPLLPEAIASGPTREAALTEMGHALVAAVRGRIKDGMDLEAPAFNQAGSGSHPVALPARLAAKASIYAAWKRSGLSKVALAERIGRGETEVRRILDPDHGTKLDQLEEAAVALGGRLSITFEAA